MNSTAIQVDMSIRPNAFVPMAPCTLAHFERTTEFLDGKVQTIDFRPRQPNLSLDCLMDEICACVGQELSKIDKPTAEVKINTWVRLAYACLNERTVRLLSGGHQLIKLHPTRMSTIKPHERDMSPLDSLAKRIKTNVRHAHLKFVDKFKDARIVEVCLGRFRIKQYRLARICLTPAQNRQNIRKYLELNTDTPLMPLSAGVYMVTHDGQPTHELVCLKCCTPLTAKRRSNIKRHLQSKRHKMLHGSAKRYDGCLF